MKTLSIGIFLKDENENIISERTLKSKWTKEKFDDIRLIKDLELEAFQSLDIKEQMAILLLMEIKNSIDLDIIQEMIEEIK